MNLEEILQDAGLETAPEGHHHARNGWIQIDCPFCSPNSKRWRMGLTSNGRVCNCWSCGPHRVADALMAALNLPFVRVKTLLGGVVAGTAPAKRTAGVYTPPRGVVAGLLPAHAAYINARGFNPVELEKLWELGSIGMAPKLSWRVFIPIVHGGKRVSWTTRAIGENVTARYINAPAEEESVPAKSILYGEDYCRNSVVLCEGPTGPWRFGPGTVASCGLGYTSAQVERLSRYTTRVVIFDSTRQAQRRAKQLCDQLEVFPGRTYRVELDSEDPGVASPKEVRLIRKQFLK